MTRSAIILLLGCLHLSSFCQQYSVLDYTVNDGLASNEVNAACEDSNGFLWLGTTNGISRFNGKHFVNYGYTEGLQDLYVQAIYEDSLHHLWIGTLHGISELKGNHFVKYHTDKNEDFIVWAFKEISRHELMAFTSKGVYYFADSVWKPANLKERFSLDNYRIGTQLISAPEGLYMNDGYRLRLKKRDTTVLLAQCPTGENYDYFFDLQQINGRVFINTRNTLYEATGGHFKTVIDKVPAENSFTYFVDKANKFWLLVAGKGLYCYADSGKSGKPSFIYNIYNALGSPFADTKGNLWVAGYRGLMRIQPKVFHEINVGNEIFFTTMGGDDQLLIFNTSGPMLLKNGVVSHLSLPASYKNFNEYLQDVVEGGTADGNGNTWMITRTWKLLRWNGTRLDDFSALIPKQQSGYIYNIGLDPVTKKVFLCGDTTVITGDEKGFAIYHDRNGKVFPKPTSVVFNRDGIGVVHVYSKGVYLVTKNNEIIKAPAALDMVDKGNYVYFFADREGCFWVSNAGKGLIKFRVTDDYQIKDVFQYTTSDGLPDNKITGVVFDKSHNAWVVTNREVDIISNSDKNLRPLETHKIGWRQGIADESNYGGYVITDNIGNVWIAGSDKVLQSKTDQLELTKTVPHAVIEKFMVNLQETDWSTYKDSLCGYFQLPYKPTLTHSQNSIGIQFTGTCLTDASQLEYSYRLEPLDTAWSAPSPNNLVSILKLSPAKYKFYVKARASKSAWSEPVIYEFTIQPPFWETWWCRLIVVLLASATIAGIFNNRVQLIKNRAALKNKIQVLETKALKAQMNPHFVYNALNSIQSLIMNDESRKAGHYISKFAQLLRQILENADNNLIGLDKELHSLRLYISLEELRLNFELKYEETIDERIDIENEKIPSLILQPFVENALWHGLSKKEGEKILRLKIKSAAEWIICEITDNGVGRGKASEQYHIFPEGHLSKASSITLQRLTNFNQQPAVEPIRFIDHIDENGRPAGTTAVISIRRTKSA